MPWPGGSEDVGDAGNASRIFPRCPEDVGVPLALIGKRRPRREGVEGGAARECRMRIMLPLHCQEYVQLDSGTISCKGLRKPISCISTPIMYVVSVFAAESSPLLVVALSLSSKSPN